MAANFGFDADGATFQKQQQYEHYMNQARLWQGRRTTGVWEAETIPAYRRLHAPQIGTGMTHTNNSSLTQSTQSTQSTERGYPDGRT